MALLDFDPNQYRTTQPGTAEVPQDQGRFGDVVDAFQSGAASGLGGIFDFVGAKGVARSLYDIAGEQNQQMSQRGQEAMAKPMFGEDEYGDIALGEGMTDLDTWLLNMASVAGQMAPTMIPGAGAAGLATKAASLGAKGAKVAQAVGMGATGGSSATGQAMEQARYEVLQMPDQVLADSDIFREKFLEADKSNPELSDLDKWNKAKENLSEQVASEVRADPKTLLANFAASAIGDPIIGKALTGARLAKAGAFRSALAGAATEGATEATQAGTTQYAINQALAQIDDRDPMKDVKISALNEATVGAGFGGIAGGVGGLMNRQPKAPAKSASADAIRDTNPGLAGAMDSMAQQDADRQDDVNNISAQATAAQVTSDIDYDQPTAARAAGVGGTMEAGSFGDQLISDADSRQQDLNNIDIASIREPQPSSEINYEQPAATRAVGIDDNVGAGRFGDQLISEEVAPVDTPAVPKADTSKITKEVDYDQPTAARAAGMGDTLQAGRFGDQIVKGEKPTKSIDEPKAKLESIKSADIKKPDSGVNIMTSGRPFSTEKGALSSKGARAAKKAGGKVEAVKRGDGFGWKVIEPTATAEVEQQADVTAEPAAKKPEATPVTPEAVAIAEPEKVKKADIAKDLAGKKIDKEWTEFAEDTQTLKIPRAEMPQIKAEHRGAMVNFMKGKDVSSEIKEVAADSLKPTQAEFSPAKVKKAMGFTDTDRSILVSSDGYVLDGHHQWLSKRQKGEAIKVIELNAPISELITLAKEFPSSTVQAGATSVDVKTRKEEKQQPTKPDAADKNIETTEDDGEGINPSIDDAKGDDLVFSKRPSRKPRRGVSVKEAQAMTDKMMKKLHGAAGITVEVIPTQAEFLRRSGKPANHYGESLIYGAMSQRGDKAYLIAENFTSISEARKTLAHEVIAHGGLRTVIGKLKYQEFIERISSTRSKKDFKALWAQIDRDYEGESDQVKAEEVFANFVQEQPDSGALGQWWNSVKIWLRRHLESIGLLTKNNTQEDFEDMLTAIVKGFEKRSRRISRAERVLRKTDYSPIQESRYSMSEAPSMSEADTRTAKEKMGLGDEAQETLGEQIKQTYTETTDTLKDSTFWSRINEGLFDSLHGIKIAEEAVGVNDPNKMGYVSARLASGLADILHGVFNYGAPEWKDGIIQRKKDTKGLLEVFGMLPEGELNNWLAWMGANRAKQLMSEGRERNLTQSDIDELLALSEGNETLFEDVRAEYNKINSAVLDVAQKSGLLSEEQRASFDEEYYVPFFREVEIDPEMQDIASMVTAPFSKKGIANQSAKIKELKGGKQSTRDLLENIIARQSTMLDASLKNKAMIEIANNLEGTDYMTKVDSPEFAALTQKELNSIQRVKVMENGQAVAYAVSDPALLRGLVAVNDVGSNALFNRLGRSAKRFLTTGITLAPDFILKNFVRDAAHAWMINKDGFKFGSDSIKGMKQAFKEDESYRDLIFSGSAFQGGYILGADPEAAALQVRRALTVKGLNKSQINGYLDSIITSGSVLLEKYKNTSDKVENANRLATYGAALAAGKTKRQAAFEAKDLMDYSMKGNFGLVSTMIDFLPFFNARLQGMYKLGRAAASSGDTDKLLKHFSANLAMKGMKLASFSLALAMMNDDDDRYKALQDWDKDANWHFWVGEDHFRIPKPFELGIIFGTMPERMFALGSGSQDISDTAKAVSHAVFNTLALNPIPQIAMPVAEIVANKSFFMDRPIEGTADQNRMPGDRYNAYTSDTAKQIGQALNVSPKKIEHLVKGYTGTLGGYVLSMSDIVARQMLGIEKAETPISRYPVIKSFYGGDTPPGGTSYQTEFYNAINEANQAYGSYKAAAESQDSERLMRVLEDNKGKLSSRIALNRVQRQIGKLGNQAKAVNNSKLSAAEKREKLEAITRQKNAIYQKAYVIFNLRDF